MTTCRRLVSPGARSPELYLIAKVTARGSRLPGWMAAGR